MSGPGVGVIQSSLGKSEAEFIIPTGAGHAGVGDVEHRNAVLVAVGNVADVNAGGSEVDDVAGGATVGEVQVAQAGVSQSSSEVVLRGDADGFEGGRASGSAVGQQNFLGATDELAVDKVVAKVEAEGLERTSEGEQLEAAGVAVLEDQRGCLVRVSSGGQSAVVRGDVNTGESEIDGGDFAHSAVDAEGAPAAGHLVAQAINVVVDGDAGEAGADRCVGDAGVSNDGLGQTASLKSFAVLGSSTSGAGTSQLDAEAALNAGVSEELLRCAQVRTNNVAVYNVTLLRSDVQIPYQNGVGSVGRWVGPVARFRLDQNQAFPQ